MAKLDPLPSAARQSIAQQLGQMLGTTGGTGLAALAAGPPPELGESLVICTITAEQVQNPPANLGELLEPSGVWHHQVFSQARPTHMARSQSGGLSGGEHYVEQWLESPIAAKVDETLAWLDEHLGDTPATVRLLVTPAYYLHALAILRGKRYSAVLVDQPPSFTRLEPQKEYPLEQFLQLLAQEQPAGTLIGPPPGPPRDGLMVMASTAPVAAVVEPQSTAELIPLMRQVTPTEQDLERQVQQALTGPQLKETLSKIPSAKVRAAIKSLQAAGGASLLTSAVEGSGDFGGIGWRVYKRLFGVKWDRKGEIRGRYSLEPSGPGDYIFRPHPTDPFYFVRHNGEEIRPGPMRTDGGSIPRVAWAVPGLDPWAYLPAYLVHDWLYTVHHCVADHAGTFEDANLIMAEVIYTMMMNGQVSADWRKVEIVYQGVSSFVARRVWNRAWTVDECQTALNPPP